MTTEKPWKDPFIRFYKVYPYRFFNICFSMENLQGDGFFRFTFILFYIAMQIRFQFSYDKHKWIPEINWRIFQPKSLS